MKKIFFTLLAFIFMGILLSGCFKSEGTAYAKKDGEAIHSPYSCNIHNCKITFSFKKGDLFTILPHPETDSFVIVYNDEWYIRVKNNDGVFGWIERKFLRKTPPD